MGCATTTTGGAPTAIRRSAVMQSDYRVSVSGPRGSKSSLADQLIQARAMEIVRKAWDGWKAHSPDEFERIKLWEEVVGEAIAEAIPKWQPIESAPKDGSEVLLLVAYRAGIPYRCLVGHWQRGGHCIEDHPPIDTGWYFWNGLMFDLAARPTHWMPLPTYPELTPPNAIQPEWDQLALGGDHV